MQVLGCVWSGPWLVQVPFGTLFCGRLATHPSRLETRTKELNMQASLRVLVKPEGEAKAKSILRWMRCDPGGSPLGATPSRRYLAQIRRRLSLRVRTRKMVTYAGVGRNQRKLWWRPEAILTCKLIVKLRYRGERLIEPSSSWFPPKFPSG